MKKILGLAAALAFVAISAAAQAANTIGVTGDIARDGYLMIDIDWSVDTAKYKGEQPEQVHQQVYEEIWNATIPKLVKATKGTAVSFDKCNFQKISETKKVLEQRPDGTKLVAVNVQVKFNAPVAAAPAKAKVSQPKPDKQTGYRFVHEARDW